MYKILNVELHNIVADFLVSRSFYGLFKSTYASGSQGLFHIITI